MAEIVTSKSGGHVFHDEIPPRRIIPVHGPREKDKLAKLTKNMNENGFEGRPVLTVNLPEGRFALTGSHRIAAAIATNTDVPVHEMNPQKFQAGLRKEGLTRDQLIGSGDATVHSFIKKHVGAKPAKLMEEDVKTGDDK